jgi:hypothetical protein
VRLGELVAANDLYQLALDEPVGPTLSRPFLEAIEAARADKKALWARLPLVELVVSGPPAATVRGYLDGHPFELAKLDAPLPLDPGEHHFEVMAPGHERAKRVVHVVEGQRLRLEIPLPAIDAPHRAPLPSASRWVPLAVSFGVGVAGLAVGAVTGIVSATEASRVDEGCVDDSCLPSDEGRADAASTLGTISTVGFLVGGAGVAVGVGLLLFQSPPDDSPRSSLRVGPGSLSFRTAF